MPFEATTMATGPNPWLSAIDAMRFPTSRRSSCGIVVATSVMS
jgi:hypothetical protein